MTENDREYRLEQFIKWHGGWEALFYALTQEERGQIFERLRERIEKWEREEE